MTTKICNVENCGKPCVGYQAMCKSCYQKERRKILGTQKKMHISKNEMRVVGGQLIIDGLRYKIGARGRAFYFDREWKLSSRDPAWVAAQIQKAGG